MIRVGDLEGFGRGRGWVVNLSRRSFYAGLGGASGVLRCGFMRDDDDVDVPEIESVDERLEFEGLSTSSGDCVPVH